MAFSMVRIRYSPGRPARRSSARAIGGFVGVLILGVATLLAAPTASAATRPRANIAYYVGSDDAQNLYDHGCDQGKRDRNLGVDSLVILDFGGQTTVSGDPGVKLVTNHSLPDAAVARLAESFGRGYYACTGSDTSTILHLAVGTNNSLRVSSYWGDVWAGLMESIQNDLGSASNQVMVWGADDFEPGFGSASAARAWAEGYSAHSGRPHYEDYGSADGCPKYGRGRCNNGWTQNDIYYVAWDADPALPVPEIYSNTLAHQWATISSTQGGMNFNASLSQYEACAQQNNPPSCRGLNIGPDESWDDLSNASGQSPTYSDDIGYSNLPYHS